MANRAIGLGTVELRYCIGFGGIQDPLSGNAAVIPKCIDLMLRGGRPPVFGDGLTSRDFTHIENVVQANLAAADEPRAAGLAINVAVGRSHTLLDLVAALNGLLGTALGPGHGPPRPGDAPDSPADIRPAPAPLGYEPR